jgi:hypothetical protein
MATSGLGTGAGSIQTRSHTGVELEVPTAGKKRKDFPPPQPNLAFVNISYIIPPSLLSKKKGKVILDSIRQVAQHEHNKVVGGTKATPPNGPADLLDLWVKQELSPMVQSTQVE